MFVNMNLNEAAAAAAAAAQHYLTWSVIIAARRTLPSERLHANLHFAQLLCLRR